MPAATKKRPPLEMEPGEGKAHESAESAAEETREGAEPDDAPKAKGSRKRSAKNSKSTKAPMDGGMYGKKPMDGEGCNCGKRKAKCDGSCAKKMDRNDSLTPQEYLAACELGIQGRSRSYIRARLDAAERLDLKCGKGSISEGEKCTKGTAQKALPKNQGVSIRKMLLVGAGISAAAALSSKQGRQSAKETVKGLYEITTGQLKNKYANAINSENANTFLRMVGNGRKTKNVEALNRAFRKPAAKRPPRRDSVYATGFSPELDQLAI
jgi:hypothetical protein